MPVKCLTQQKVAKERICTIIQSDRMECNPDFITQYVAEIRKVTEKYFGLTNREVVIKLQFTNGKRQGVEYVKTIQIERL